MNPCYSFELQMRHFQKTPIFPFFNIQLGKFLITTSLSNYKLKCFCVLAPVFKSRKFKRFIFRIMQFFN